MKEFDILNFPFYPCRLFSKYKRKDCSLVPAQHPTEPICRELLSFRKYFVGGWAALESKKEKKKSNTAERNDAMERCVRLQEHTSQFLEIAVNLREILLHKIEKMIIKITNYFWHRVTTLNNL